MVNSKITIRFHSFADHPNFSLCVIVSFILLSYFRSQITVCAADDQGNAPRFSYDEATGRGPSRWGQLDPNWYLCGNGTRQSPINFFKSMVQLRPDLGELQTDYRPTPTILYNRGKEIEVNWNGSDAGNLTINGTQYKLLETHWHTPSEHKLHGRRFALEIHLVHKSAIGETAVVGILYKYGRPDPFLSRLYTQIQSLRNGTRQIPLGIVDPRNIEYAGIWRKYYRYNGSLTTPPCDENVLWTVLKRVQTVSRPQVRVLKEAVDEGFEENARPTQPLNGRPVYLYSRWFF